MKFEIIKGDLIQLALSGKFDVIAHGCNCFCIQKAGIAAQMSKHFNTDDFSFYKMEMPQYQGNFNKLGTIDWSAFVKVLPSDSFYIQLPKHSSQLYPNPSHYLTVINAYTQYELGKNLDYEALTLCMRKINYEFQDKHIGLPWIGCGIAGGNKDKVEQILRKELKDCNVTVCEL